MSVDKKHANDCNILGELLGKIATTRLKIEKYLLTLNLPSLSGDDLSIDPLPVSKLRGGKEIPCMDACPSRASTRNPCESSADIIPCPSSPKELNIISKAHP